MKYAEFIQNYSDYKDTDISSHLPTIYREAYKISPKVIVELGVRGGESSIVFSCIAEELGSKVYGIDIEPCEYGTIRNGHFICGDDIEVAKKFSESIDVLMIDTSHLFQHTRGEIAGWFPHLSERAVIFFHDTNIDGKGYLRANGSRGANWDNDRGVIRALEEWSCMEFDESTDFEMQFEKNGSKWSLKHYTICNGLMVIHKSPLAL
jgi:cephalosporin hydroxylase